MAGYRIGCPGVKRGNEDSNPASASGGTGGRPPRAVGHVETAEGGRDPRPPLPLRPPLEGRIDLRRGRLRLARLYHLPGRPPSLRRAALGPTEPPHPRG